MDMSALVLPGAQSLVSSILTDGWTQARSALARIWSRKGEVSQEAAETELEKGYRLSEQIAGGDQDRRVILEAYWAGFLAGLAAGQADLLEAVRELAASTTAAATGPTVHNSNSNTGTATTLVQAGDMQVHGDVNFGR